MLTANYLQRSLFKWKSAILAIAIISGMSAFFSVQINRWVPNYALSFCGLIAQQFHTQISFRTVHYRFPDSIIFKNVNVLEFDGKAPLLQASRVSLGFFFNNIVINDLNVNFPALKDYLKLHGKEIHAWARTLPKRNMHLIVPDGRLYLKGPPGDPVTFRVDLRRDQDHLNARGYWSGTDKFNYEFDGNIRPSGFDLDRFTLKSGRSSMNLWGSWQYDTIDWKGFIFYDKFYILDINGKLNIQDKDIVLKQLSFSVNGNGVGALGHCSRQEFFQCDGDIALKNTKLHLHAQNTPQGGLVLDGTADLGRAHVDFKNLRARIINGNSLTLKIGSCPVSLNKLVPVTIFPFENILASINAVDHDRKTISLSARIFGGYYHSRIFLDTASFPWQIKAQGGFEGKNMDFNNTPLQAWLAKTLQMPSLSRLSGASLSFRFSTDGRSKMVEGLKLKNDDLDLRGSFNTDADDLVSSRGSVRFSKKLLGESPVGRHLMGLVAGAWTLPFEFRLSGNIYRMNFQWDNSPLKDKVRRHLFSFFERMIDRRMDAHPSYNVTIPSESVSPG